MRLLPPEEVPLAFVVLGPGVVLRTGPHCYFGWMEQSLMRPRNRKIIAGVCAALADRFGISRTLVRIGFVFFGLFGIGELVYIVLWIIIPKSR